MPALRRRGALIVACVLVGMVAAVVKAETSQSKYTATATLLFQNSDLSQQLFGYATSSVVNPTAEAATNLSLVTQPAVARLAARALGISRQAVAGSISAGAVAASDVVAVSATTDAPESAARLANVYTRAFVAYRQAAEKAQVAQAAGELQSQVSRLARLPSSDPAVAQLPTLRARLSQLEVLEAIQTGDVQQVSTAEVPTSRSAPSTKRDAALGILLGLIVGLIAAYLTERLDDRLRHPDEIRAIIRLPVLASVPTSRALSHRGLTGPPAAEAEVFRILRAQLRYISVDDPIRSVVLNSSQPGDGKSTVAWNLALAASEVDGPDSVLFVDADFRASPITDAPGIQTRLGLADVLAKGASLDRAIQRVSVTRADDDVPVQVHVLPAGSDVPNPFAVLASEKMRELVRQLQSMYDFIVFDAPPTSVVSDSIPLIELVDGVIVVARLKHTARSTLSRLREQLTELNATCLGVIVNAAEAPSTGYYSYYRGGLARAPRGADGTIERPALDSVDE